jgi:transketolase
MLEALVASGALDGKEFAKLGLSDYPECGTPLEVLEYHGLDGTSLAGRISGAEDIEAEDQGLHQKYTEEAPQ